MQHLSCKLFAGMPPPLLFLLYSFLLSLHSNYRRHSNWPRLFLVFSPSSIIITIIYLLIQFARRLHRFNEDPFRAIHYRLIRATTLFVCLSDCSCHTAAPGAVAAAADFGCLHPQWLARVQRPVLLLLWLLLSPLSSALFVCNILVSVAQRVATASHCDCPALHNLSLSLAFCFDQLPLVCVCESSHLLTLPLSLLFIPQHTL